MAMGLMEADFKQMNRVPGESVVFIGVDLGKRGTPSTMVLVERFEEWPSELGDVLRGVAVRNRYVVRQAERMRLGTPYREVMLRIKQAVERVTGTGRRCVLVVDEGGPGVPVVERMREVGMGCPIFPYTITPGQQATSSTVPRTVLLTKMQIMFECGELEIAAGCRDAEQLERELVYLQLDGRGYGGGSGSGSGSSSGSREKDELALALALACWKARVR